MFEEEENPISKHVSYNEYQKKITKSSSESIAIFVSAFFILLLLFLGIAKQLSPEIDVSIGDSENASSDSMGIEKSSVDERLKLLQMEDSDKDNMFNDALEEKVVIPDGIHTAVQKTDDEKDNKPVESSANPKPEETASNSPKIPLQTLEQAGNLSVKVVVGYYSSKEQANVAKEIIAESGMNISPYVRAIGGGYTIQVGSFASREKAQSLANELLRNNYPAKVIME